MSTLSNTPLPPALSLAENSAVVEVQLFSQVLKACADPLRVQILQVLKFDTFGVMELTLLFNTKQSGMSHHLKVLNQAGLVEAQKEGNAVFYRRSFRQSPKHDQAAIEQLFLLIDRFQLDDSLGHNIREIQAQRAIQSQVFFAKYADQFQEQQELIADHKQYAQASFELLVQPFKSRPALPNNATVMEIGPGEGLFLKPLSHRFEQVIALDNSNNMLDKAKYFALNEKLDNIEFYLGDSESFRSQANRSNKESIDAVVMNMVLHHIPTPALVFKDVFSFLSPGGIFVICDLSHHNQEWTKKSCGDLWLGFEKEKLSSWATLAGFEEEKSVYIGLRNGFQIQLRKFIKP